MHSASESGSSREPGGAAIPVTGVSGDGAADPRPVAAASKTSPTVPTAFPLRGSILTCRNPVGRSQLSPQEEGARVRALQLDWKRRVQEVQQFWEAYGDVRLLPPAPDEVLALVREHLVRPGAPEPVEACWVYARWKPATSLTAGFQLDYADGRRRWVTWKRYADGKAAELAAELLRVNPDEPGNLTNLGHFHARLGNDGQATRYLERARAVAVLEALAPESRPTRGGAVWVWVNGGLDDRGIGRSPREAHERDRC